MPIPPPGHLTQDSFDDRYSDGKTSTFFCPATPSFPCCTDDGEQRLFSARSLLLPPTSTTPEEITTIFPNPHLRFTNAARSSFAPSFVSLTLHLTGRPERRLLCAIMQRSGMAAQSERRGGLSELKCLVRCFNDYISLTPSALIRRLFFLNRIGNVDKETHLPDMTTLNFLHQPYLSRYKYPRHISLHI